AVLDDPGVEQALVILTPQSMTDIDEIARGICRIHRGADKPIACSFMGATDVAPGIRLLEEAHIPHYILPEHACRAMADVQQIRAWRGKPLDQRERPVDDWAAAVSILDPARPGYLPEDQALEVLSTYGLPVPPHRLCSTAAEAAQFAAEIGFPVVLRVVSPEIVHKSEAMALALNLGDARAVRKAYDRMLGRLAENHPEAEIHGVLVRPMIPAGHEVILGAKRDPAFGPVLMFGLGGIYVELFEDVTFALAPIGRRGAGRMLRRVRAHRLLEGLRGNEPADVAGVEACLIRLGQLVSDFDRIVELDVNPLIVGPADVGCAVADVRIRLGE
ncbi:MAG: acetate--CoA ligase family protein, partial [Planctomycetota bacterium]